MERFSLPEGEIYHFYGRGVEKRSIFLDQDDYDRFLSVLYLCNGERHISVSEIQKSDRYVFERGEKLAQIGAFCLMPNHFHLIVRQYKEKGAEKMMQKILTSYVMYFNKKHERKGRLFESSYHAKHVSTDEQLRHLFAYVHLNPISLVEPNWKRVGIKSPEAIIDALMETKVTSFSLLCDNSNTKDSEKRRILDSDAFPAFFCITGDGRAILHEWMNMYSVRPVEERFDSRGF